MQRLATCSLLTILCLTFLPALGAPAVLGTADKKAPSNASVKKPEGKPAAQPGAAKPAETKPSTYKVRKRTFRIDVALEGVFEAKSVAEVVLRPKEWSDFEVLKAVEHGTVVKPGDLLVSIDTEKIDKAIADLERDLTLARLSLQETEVQLQLARSTGPMDLAAGERSKRSIDQDMAHYLKVERPMMERTLNFMVKMAEDRLAYEQEELRQLEKMYKADDLTEETEEIILRRARDSVAQAKFSLERTVTERDSLLKISMPRAEEALKQAVARQAIELKKTQASVPTAQRKIELALEKIRVDLGRNDERLRRLVADRKLMNVKATIGGIAYYGRVVRGKWIGAEMSADKLRRGARLMPEDVFLTIVEPRPIAVRTAASEKQLRYVATGVKATVTPTAFPDLKLDAIVERVSGVPGTAKEFDTVLTLALGDRSQAVMPGMTCEVKIYVFGKPDPLAIPLAALGIDEANPQKCVVALPGKGVQPIRREVVVGLRSERLAEIVKGLSEGEEILAEFPKEKE